MLRKLTPVLLISTLLIGCNQETKTIQFKALQLEQEFNSDITVEYDFATGNTAVSNTINNVMEQVIVEMIGIDTLSTSIDTVVKKFDNQYLEFISDFPDASLSKWELQVETEQTYQSEDVITIAISVYQYQGGAHGNSQIQLLNIDPKSGNRLGRDDIITDVEGFKSLAKSHFLQNLNDKDEKLSIEDYFFGEPFHLPEHMGFSEDGFILLYNVYEIASYAQGYTEFAISYEAMNPFLKLF